MMKRKRRPKWRPIDYGEVSKLEIKCDYCNSTHIIYNDFLHPREVIYKCTDCNYTWREPRVFDG